MSDSGSRSGLVMELAVTPLIALWQTAFAARYRAGSSTAETDRA